MKILKSVVIGCVMGGVFAASAFAACDPDRISIPTSRYEMNGAEVRDTQTGLVWQRCSVGQTWQDGQGCTGTVQELTWEDAMKQAGGGWRLPTRDELSGLISMACSPSINPDAFPGLDMMKLWYWSGTQNDKDLAWMVQFGGGATFNGYRTSLNSVRLVRDGN